MEWILPQLANEEMQRKLEQLFQQNNLSQVRTLVVNKIPENFLDKETEQFLEQLYQQQKLFVTPKATYCVHINGNFIALAGLYDVVEYEGEKYVRCISENDMPGIFLSDGREIKKGDVRYCRVIPIEQIYGFEPKKQQRKKQ